MKEQIDIFDDLLIEFDEMGFVPTNFPHDHDGEYYAIDWRNRLINALEGYRKQGEGEWEPWGEMFYCSLCTKNERYKSPFCPNCGAKMKGGAE